MTKELIKLVKFTASETSEPTRLNNEDAISILDDFLNTPKMELQTAIEILEYHQAWRLGLKQDMIHEPKKLTEALDIVLKEVKKKEPVKK
jgi:hypothetical protein